MGDADDPSRDSNQLPRNDELDLKEDEHYFAKLLTHLQTFLPFLTQVIDNSQLLEILPDRVSKLRYLYELVDAKRLSPDRLKTCKKVFYDLYDNYSNPLNYYLPADFKTSWMQETKLNDEEKNVSSEVRYTSNESNQNQNSESELSSKIPVASTSYEKIANNQMDCLEDLTPNNEITSNKNIKTVKIGESSCSKNSIVDPVLSKNDLPEFSDSRLRLNKMIGFVANLSIEKLNKSDASTPHTELTTQIFDEIIKQNNDPVIYKDMLKDINMDDIDVNYVKKVIDGIQRASFVEPVQPPPLPPSDLMDLGASTISLISTIEPNISERTHDNVLLNKSSTIIRPQLNTEINKLHKTGLSNQIQPKFISALKPGTLIDLENSKVVSASLHIESLRPIIKSNEKNTDIKTPVADISVPRDPRIRHKPLLSSENNVSPFNPPASLLSNGQYTFPTPYASNRDNSNAKLFETRAQEISVYGGQSSSSHTYIQPLNPLFSSEHNGSSIQFKNRPLSQYQKHNRNDDKRNDFGQFSNSTIMHVSPSHTEPLTKYCDPVPYKSHSHDVSKRDPRILKSVKTQVSHSAVGRIQHSNYKEYREAKYREQNKGLPKNKNQMNQDHDQHRNLMHDKIEKNNIIDSSYNTFGPVNETANIKSFKIPKIKHNEELNDNSTEKDSKPKTFEVNKNNTDVLKTEKNTKIHLKADTIRKDNLVDSQNTEIKKSKNSKKDPKINDCNTDKDLLLGITKNRNTEKDLKIKTMLMNAESAKDDSSPEITTNIPSQVNKDELDSKSEQNSILIDRKEENKPKKQKKYSKEKEFEKIVRDAKSLNGDVWGPRTRSCVVKKQEILKTLKVSNSKPKLEKDITAKNYKKLESGECSKNLDNESIPNLEDISVQKEIGHNIISSTSKEQSGVINSTTTEIMCINQEENIVSSNEINSTADNKSTIDQKALIDILKNPKFMSVISIFQDNDKLEKLTKLLESPDVNTNSDKLKKKDVLNKEQLDEKKKIKRKMKKEKRKLRKMKKNIGKVSKDNISVDTNFSQVENIVRTKKKNSQINEGNTSSENIYCNSLTDQHKSKFIKRKKSKESYGNFEIRKDKCKPELKDLKIVIAKFDKNVKRSENFNSDISSTSNDKQTNSQSINVEVPEEIKPKKPFLGPLSVKLARQKLEMERSNSQNELDIKNKLESETKKVRKGSKSVNIFDEKGKLNPETVTSLMVDQPTVLICPLEIPKSFVDEINSNKSVEQNSNISTFNVNKPEFKKARPSELDKLHADISEMFDCKAVLNAPIIRQCRTNKQIDYVNTNVVTSKKKKTSNIEELDSNDDQNELNLNVEKTKSTKKKVKKSTIKLNTKKNTVKKSMANKTLPPVVVKTAVLNKTSNKQQDNLKKKKKKGNKKFKKFNRRNSKVVLCDEFKLNNVLENKTSTEITSKIGTENTFYFQTADNSLECKFCNYKGTGLNIVRHYKDKHCGEEVLPSRLPKNCTESLIQQSLKENFGYLNSQDSKPFCVQSVNVNLNVNFTCVFCQVIFHDYFKFYDHLTDHTGEYRYKCKMCEQIYSNEDDLDKHILEHPEYDKTDGVSHLIFPNPIRGEYVFGYLCSFCYYIQLYYNNIVKHMASKHFDEDKKLNGHWTVIRISMSETDIGYTDSSIDFVNLVGCLPPIQFDQVISKSSDNEDQNQQLTVTDLNVLSNEQEQQNSFFSIKKECNDQNIDEIPHKLIIDESPAELSIYENPADLTINTNFPELTINENPPESNIDENLPVIHKNPSVSVYDTILPESNILQFLTEQANKSLTKEIRISTEQPVIEYSEYTLKDKSEKCVLSGLSCELINSMLLFKCSVSNCLENQFSTVVLIDFSKHINKNHSFVKWDGNCEACHEKPQTASEQYYVRNALEHLIAHHLVLKNSEQHPDTTLANLGDSKIESSSSCHDTVKNTPVLVRVRNLPGDTLSIRKSSSSSITNICDVAVNKSVNDDNNSIMKNVNPNINHGSNDERFPLLSSRISDIKSLKKGKVKTSNINSSASDNNDLNMWMKAKTNCEVVLPNSEIFLEEGQQIVNNGVPVGGTICLIDTAYTKDYIRKVRDLPMNVMKTRIALNEMSALPRLLGLFKCMDRSCTKIFNSKDLFKLHMKLHFSNAEKKKKKPNVQC